MKEIQLKEVRYFVYRGTGKNKHNYVVFSTPSPRWSRALHQFYDQSYDEHTLTEATRKKAVKLGIQMPNYHKMLDQPCEGGLFEPKDCKCVYDNLDVEQRLLHCTYHTVLMLKEKLAEKEVLEQSERAAEQASEATSGIVRSRSLVAA